MSFEVKPFSIKSSDGIHTLQGKIYLPEGEIKGIFHLVHGMTEHIERYDHIFSALAEDGFIAAGFDNLGHGRTANDDSELGFIASSDGWQRLIEDAGNFGRKLKEIYPDKPLYLMGHSMGSFIARLAAEQYPALYEKLIFCGTAGKNPLAKAGLLLTKVIKKLKGEKHISKLCNNMAFGSYNKKFSGDTPYEWLTRDREVIKKYSADKFCTFKFTVSALYDLITLIDKCNRKAWFKNISKTAPVLLIAGEADPVGNYGKGVQQVYENLRKEDCKAFLKLYKAARHEIHNDFCKEEVISDILRFLKSEK